MKSGGDLAVGAAESIVNDVGMFVENYNNLYWNSRNFVFKRKRLESIPEFYSPDPLIRIDGINLAYKEGFLSLPECKAFIELTGLEFKVRNLIKTYQLAYGKDGVKSVDDMDMDELISHANMLIKSTPELNFN